MGNVMDNLHALTVRIYRLVLIITCLAGCGSTESEKVESKEIYARFDVIADDSGNTEVKARLKEGSDKFPFEEDLHLSRGDELVVYANGLAQVMSEVKVLLGIFHTTTFRFNSGGMEFQIAFERQRHASAPDSRVSLPDPFDITTVAGQEYSEGGSVAVAWDPANRPDKMIILLRLECEDASNDWHYGFYAVTVADSGLRDLPVDAILRGAHIDASEYANGCDLEIVVQRERKGTLDRNYGNGGHVYARQERVIAAKIAPPP